mgnify:CR=1 FL=1
MRVGDVVGSAVIFCARFNSRPPDAPVTNKVVPTDNKKIRVYFLVGSKLASVVNGLVETTSEVEVSSALFALAAILSNTAQGIPG